MSVIEYCGGVGVGLCACAAKAAHKHMIISRKLFIISCFRVFFSFTMLLRSFGGEVLENFPQSASGQLLRLGRVTNHERDDRVHAGLDLEVPFGRHGAERYC